ncbi:MAG: anion permease, partial [Rhizobiaceae bacterium]|nr:anion permease [Rhizobiaceae bacterium]
LVPVRKDRAAEMVSDSSFEAELHVSDDAPSVGRLVTEFEAQAEDADVLLVGLVRKGQRYRGARLYTIQPDDHLVIRGSSDAIAAFIKATNLQEASPVDEDEDSEADAKPDAENGDEDSDDDDKERADEPAIVEAVVRANSHIVGSTAEWHRLRQRYGLTLLGISQGGSIKREQVSNRVIEAGDVLLLSGPRASSVATLDSLGLVAVNQISVSPFRIWNVAAAVGLFAAAIAAASFGLLSFTVAIAVAVVGYAALGLVPAREFYQTIEWPVVVMLACLLPIGAAFDQVGGTALIAGGISQLAQGYPPVIALVAIMAATMMLSDVLNNVATMVITGPIAIDLAQRLDANPDTFLMGVAIAASCAFLTPIGHKNNTLIMGPGGFRFSDYWRMGLPLEVVVLVVAVPALLFFWPL